VGLLSGVNIPDVIINSLLFAHNHAPAQPAPTKQNNIDTKPIRFHPKIDSIESIHVPILAKAIIAAAEKNILDNDNSIGVEFIRNPTAIRIATTKLTTPHPQAIFHMAHPPKQFAPSCQIL
jgi:hypothetical protein